MIRRLIVLVPLVATALMLSILPAQAQWSSHLQGGGEVNVDPQTNRATITRHGVTTQAWDGVHQLEDGSTLIIRSGQAVPNESILRARRQPTPSVTDQASAWVGTPITGSSPCEQLEQLVCGRNRQCAQETGCLATLQLRAMEREELDTGGRANMTYSSGQCMEALKDKDYFRECQQ